MRKDTSGPAFPTLDYITPERLAYNSVGMSLRDYFAAKAMQGMISNPDCTGDRKQDVVREAYEFADAMLEERAK